MTTITTLKTTKDNDIVLFWLRSNKIVDLCCFYSLCLLIAVVLVVVVCVCYCCHNVVIVALVFVVVVVVTVVVFVTVVAECEQPHATST